MDERYIALAIPAFLLFMAVEFAVGRRSIPGLYRFHDTVANLSCGIGQQVLGPIINLVLLATYSWTWEHWAVQRISDDSVLGWVALLFAVDLAYYAFHRASHRVNFLWAGHIVHHQSQQYNLSVALRQNWFEKLFEWVFYVPLAIAGFPPSMFLVMTTLNTLYQFWIHTRVIGRLGLVEGILNTPSAHRVHHGINPEYIDKNFGGVFAVWDRLFGTWQPEGQEPVYGTVHPLRSFNPLWANTHYFLEIAQQMRAATRLRDKLRVPFAPPEWRPLEQGGPAMIPLVSRSSQLIYDIDSSRSSDTRVAVQLLMVVAATAWFLASRGHPNLVRPLAACAIVAATLVWSATIERRPWRWIATVGRNASIGAVCLVFLVG